MPTVVIKPLVNEKINELYEALLEEDYFSEEENAFAYCDAIEAFILSIHEQKHRKTRDNKYGAFYTTYKASRRTTWYITFDVQDDIYLIRNVLNNHTEEYPKFIAGL